MMLHRHHIIPRHAGGLDTPDNIIWLSIADHAEAHKKLYDLYGSEFDRLAWLGLARLIGKDEILRLIQMAPKSESHRAKLRGIPKSEEHRAKLAARHRGKKHTAETRTKMSLAHQNCSETLRAHWSASRRGKAKSLEHRAKIAAAHIGKKHSVETRAKMSLAQRKRIHGTMDLSEMSDGACVVGATV